jgi:hypothetical protein
MLALEIGKAPVSSILTGFALQVTDRFCTAGLLALLAHRYHKYDGPFWHYSSIFIWLMILDIVSHWTQMYRCMRACRIPRHLCTSSSRTCVCSSLMAGSSSHKGMKDEGALLRFYYTYPKASRCSWFAAFDLRGGNCRPYSGCASGASSSWPPHS